MLFTTSLRSAQQPQLASKDNTFANCSSLLWDDPNFIKKYDQTSKTDVFRARVVDKWSSRSGTSTVICCHSLHHLLYCRILCHPFWMFCCGPVMSYIRWVHWQITKNLCIFTMVWFNHCRLWIPLLLKCGQFCNYPDTHGFVQHKCEPPWAKRRFQIRLTNFLCVWENRTHYKNITHSGRLPMRAEGTSGRWKIPTNPIFMDCYSEVWGKIVPMQKRLPQPQSQLVTLTLVVAVTICRCVNMALAVAYLACPVLNRTLCICVPDVHYGAWLRTPMDTERCSVCARLVLQRLGPCPLGNSNSPPTVLLLCTRPLSCSLLTNLLISKNW